MSKRIMAAATAAAMAAMLAGAAAAQPMSTWTEPSGAFSIQRPAGWPVDRMSDSGPQMTHYAAGLAAAECSFFSITRPETATASPAQVHAAFTPPLSAETWAQLATSVSRVFEGGAPTLRASNVDTSHFWPIQRATFAAGSTTVQGAVIARPGREVWAFCQSFDSADRTDIFNSIIGSLATPQDAALQAQAEAAAAPPPPAPPPASPPAPHH